MNSKPALRLTSVFPVPLPTVRSTGPRRVLRALPETFERYGYMCLRVGILSSAYPRPWHARRLPFAGRRDACESPTRPESVWRSSSSE